MGSEAAFVSAGATLAAGSRDPVIRAKKYDCTAGYFRGREPAAKEETIFREDFLSKLRFFTA